MKFTARAILTISAAAINGATAYPLLDLPEENQPLVQPPRLGESTASDDGSSIITATLTYGVVRYIGPAYNTVLKLYNGGITPTIRLKPGDILQVTLINDLEIPEGTHTHNQYQLPNTTNLHTHGPHISGEDPGDNIFIEIGPQENHTYTYTIRKDHMPGTFWYHPHFHGSTFLQTAQGAAGLLIIEDPPNYLPKDIEEMPQVEMVFHHLDLTNLRTSSNTSGSLLTTFTEGDNFETTNVTTDDVNFFLVNMQYHPVVTMDVGKWYRLRMVQSSAWESFAVRPEDNSNCAMRLLARDGIYLQDAPREVSTMILSPGNRADVAIRCDSVSTDIKMEIVARGQGSFDLDVTPEAVQDYLFMINAVDNGVSADPDLEPFTLTRPCYLADLRGEDVEVDQITPIEFGCNADGCYENQIPWVDKFTYMAEFALGTVQEIVIENSDAHPYHQHVNPFQLISTCDNATSTDSISDWYKVGDWQDVLMIPVDNSCISTIRFAANSFLGHMVQHCHFLAHEDRGMMGQFNLVGTEGTTWERATEIDPTCVLPGQSPPEPEDTTPDPPGMTSAPSPSVTKAGKTNGKSTKSAKAKILTEDDHHGADSLFE